MLVHIYNMSISLDNLFTIPASEAVSEVGGVVFEDYEARQSHKANLVTFFIVHVILFYFVARINSLRTPYRL